MMVHNIFYFLILTLVSALVSADDPYYPCKSYIGFYYDDSNVLSSSNFKTQMNFIKNAIGNLNNPQRLAAEGGYGGEFSWNSKFSISQMQSALDVAEQTLIPYSLLQQFSSLATNFENLNNFNDNFAVLIFISDTSDQALRNADRLLSKLKGIRLTFVLLGTNVDSTKLRKFTTNFLYWPDLTQAQPDNWEFLYYHAYGCDISNVTSSTTTTPAATTTAPPPGSYYPCQNWITVLADNSNKLTASQFQAQLNFTKSILSQLTHAERIRYGYYYESQGNIVYPWDPNNSQQGLQQAIDNTTQANNPPGLSRAMRVLIAYENQNWTIPDSTVIFVTDTSNNIQIQQAVNFFNANLKPLGIKLTFILAGSNTNANALSGFDDAIIYNWQNIGFYSQPDGWDLATALRCTQQPATTPSSYIPCQSWISFGVDDSNKLSGKDFATQLNFISSAIGALNHPERIQAIGMFSQHATWNSGLSIQQIQNAVTTVQQGGPYSLRSQFASLITNLYNIQVYNIPIGALIFISDTSDAALQGAANLFPQMTNVRITFVLLGQNVDPTKLLQFSPNFIYWQDLSLPQPNNWNNLYYGAYGCATMDVNN